jgi:hypothetical protein
VGEHRLEAALLVWGFATHSPLFIRSSGPALEPTLGVRRIAIPDSPIDGATIAAVAFLRMTAEFCEAPLFPTADPSALTSGDAAVAVGDVYDPAGRRYGRVPPGLLSAAGLVYSQFGVEIVSRILAAHGRELGEYAVSFCDCVYQSFVR